jgi:hypothetical protein
LQTAFVQSKTQYPRDPSERAGCDALHPPTGRSANPVPLETQWLHKTSEFSYVTH